MLYADSMRTLCGLYATRAGGLLRSPEGADQLLTDHGIPRYDGSVDSDLFDPNRFAWMQGDPFAAWVSANTFAHYDEHLADLSVWLHK